MDDYVKTSAEGIYKNKRTGMLINRDMKELDHYRRERSRILENKKLSDRLEKLEELVRTLVTHVVGNNGRASS